MSDTVPAEISAQLSQALDVIERHLESTLLAVHRNRMAMRQTGLAELRSNLSNESTHLAYLRLAISLVVFGITLNQFSQFMQDQNRMGIGVVRALWRDTEFAGAGMVIGGLLVALWSLYRYWTVRQAIRHGLYKPLDVAVVILSLLLIVPAAATAVWIFN